MKLSYLVEVTTDDLEIARINKGRSGMGTAVWDAKDLVQNSIIEGLSKKFVASISVAEAKPVEEQKVGDEVV